MKKLFVLVLVLILAISAALAETYSVTATVTETSEKEAVLVLDGLRYVVEKGRLEQGDSVSLIMWDMKTISKMDDVIISATCGMRVIHVEMLGGVTPRRTTAGK